MPGAVLKVALDTTNPIAYGMPDKVDIFFDSSPVYEMAPNATMKGIHPLMWFDSDKPLRSGWAWGQNYLNGGMEAATVDMGKGKLYLLAPEVTFRGQPHGTFKLLFNSIYYGPAKK